MPETLPPVAAHDAEARRLALAALAAGRAAWRSVSLADISGTWERSLDRLLATMTVLQSQAATAGGAYTADALAAQGDYEAPRAFVDPEGFAGTAPDGRELGPLLYSPATKVKAYIDRGVEPAQALRMGRNHLDVIARTVVADTARAAASVDIATRPNVGYTRMLVPPSCGRCAVLAGRFYRWNQGFQRHPRCDCKHIPSRESVAEDLTTDPYEYFKSLSATEQDKLFGKGEAQAIRDGADVYQVVNAARGTSYAGISADGTRRGQTRGSTTTEGTSRRGAYGRGKPPRLTPEAIYSRAGSREEALGLLERNGYILPGGQQPGGVIRGDVEGFGALGRGGTRVGARQAVLRARETGVRDPMTRATMTEAERRHLDAQLNWDAVSRGRNPFGRGRLTPQLAAAVENDYRRIVLQGDAAAKITARRSQAANR